MQAVACLKRPNFLEVIVPSTTPRSEAQVRAEGTPGLRIPPGRQTYSSQRSLDYELFNRSNLNICCWSWNYRGCWHQTCPPIDAHEEVYATSIPSTGLDSPVSLFLVTTSLCQDWAICVPAAFLRCGSHLSSSLSGTKP